MAAQAEIKRYAANLQDEVDSAAIYRAMASVEPDAHVREVYGKLADVEERHAAIWGKQLERAGAPRKNVAPTLRARILIGLAKRFGARAVLPTVADLERQNRHVYDRQPEATRTMRGQERSHARLLRVLSGAGGAEGATVASLEGRHRAASGNALRAAVLGANDGLVTSLSLVMGAFGASMGERQILVTGLAGLLAGALSMAMGEWISVQSSRELYEQQVGIEADEIATIPDEEAQELALIYMAKGVPEEEAKQLASRLMADQKTALDTMTREELGFDPAELGGSPHVAAITSFLLFALGAIGPVLPFAFLHGDLAAIVAVAIGAALLFSIGAAITLFTGRGVLVSGARQLAFGAAAAIVTFGLGRLIGAHLG